MAKKTKSEDQERDEVLKRMLKMPPTPHKSARKRKTKSRKAPKK